MGMVVRQGIRSVNDVPSWNGATQLHYNWMKKQADAYLQNLGTSQMKMACVLQNRTVNFVTQDTEPLVVMGWSLFHLHHSEEASEGPEL